MNIEPRLSMVLSLICTATALFSVSCVRTKHFGQWISIGEESNLSHSIPLVPVKFFNTSSGVGVKGITIQTTDDGGKNWTTSYDMEGIGVYAGLFATDLEGWIVGTQNLEKPLVLNTTDGGISWRTTNFDQKGLDRLREEKFTYFRNLCFDDANTIWLAGDGGIVQVDVDGQELRVVSVFQTKDKLDSISCNDGEVWAVGFSNTVYHYQSVWMKYDLDQKYRFIKVLAVDDDTWLLGKDNAEKGVLLKSQNGGRTWDDKAPEASTVLNDLSITNEAVWLVGAAGCIYYSTDHGRSWSRSESPTKNDLYYIYFLNPDNGWITGEKGTMLKYRR